MKVLVLYHQNTFVDRSTIDEHLYALRNYGGVPNLYVNANFPMPPFLHKVNFDLIIFHFTFLRLRWEEPRAFGAMLHRYRRLRDHRAYKLAIAQDEFARPESLCEFLRTFNINRLQTCFHSRDWEFVYPKAARGETALETVLTGYVDDRALREVSELRRPHRERAIDVGYRARRVPFWVGEFGTLKWKITDAFKRAAPSFPDLKFDLSNEDHDAFVGKSWLDFLLRSRVTIGCEGGGSLLDRDGSIRRKVDDYVREHPETSFEDVRERFFKDKDHNISLYALSPRHFEACLTRTCQVLVDGAYNDVLVPERHFIPLRADFSNIDEVLRKVRDVDFCEDMAERTFREVAQNPKYSYAAYVAGILSHVRPSPTTRDSWWALVRFGNHVCRCIGFFKILLTGWLREQFKRLLRSLGVFTLAKYYYHRFKAQR